LVALVGLFRFSGCRRVPQTARKRGAEATRSSNIRSTPEKAPALTAVQRQTLAQRLKKAAEDAGGAEVWVKSLPAVQADTTSPSAVPIEALALPAAFDSVLASIKRAADGPQLQAAVYIDRIEAPPGLRVATIQVIHGGEPVENWRLREVSQLFRAAIVIDDLGQNRKTTDHLLAISYPLTFSI